MVSIIFFSTRRHRRSFIIARPRSFCGQIEASKAFAERAAPGEEGCVCHGSLWKGIGLSKSRVSREPFARFERLAPPPRHSLQQ
jgi:hypothetical protein